MEPEDAALRVGRVEEVLGRPVVEMTAAAALERRASFVDFYRDSRDRLAGALALTLGDAHLGTEAVDEAMARAYQRWDRVGAYDDPSAWVYRVGHNWAVSALRHRRRRPVVEERPDDPGPLPEPTVTAALAELPLGQRAVVVCRFYLGLSVAETAAALQIRPGTVKSRLSRGLQHLQVRLAHLRFEEQP
jgi:RNA polymerase sigma-70 factor (ECF subfamily)